MSNAANPKNVQAKNRRERRAQERKASDLRWVMSEPQGRRFIWGLLTNINKSTFDLNPSLAALKEGSRNKELEIQAAVLELCPDLYLKAQAEAMHQKTQEDAEDRALNPEMEEENG